MDIFKTIMKNIAGDQKRNLPHLLFQSGKYILNIK